jgi:hypothetical protein
MDGLVRLTRLADAWAGPAAARSADRRKAKDRDCRWAEARGSQWEAVHDCRLAKDAKVGQDVVARRRGERHRVADRVLAGQNAEIGNAGRARCLGLGRVASRAAMAGHEERPAPVAALPENLQEPGFAVASPPALELRAWLARERPRFAALPAPREPGQELALRERLAE